jgi:hypothetical protein
MENRDNKRHERDNVISDSRGMDFKNGHVQSVAVHGMPGLLRNIQSGGPATKI